MSFYFSKDRLEVLRFRVKRDTALIEC